MSRLENPHRVELAASASTVDIVSIPTHFYAAKCGLLEHLFIPLLSCAQDASDLMGLRVADDKAALRASAYLAGELLRDASFTPSRSWISNTSHAYVIDLPGNKFQVETSVLTAKKDMTSMFRLKVAGAIRGDSFVVSDPVTKMSLFSFTRFEAEKKDFFARDFPFLAMESRKDPTLFVGAREALLRGVVDLSIGVPVGDGMVMVRIYKQPDNLCVEVKDHATNTTFMQLPFASLGNMCKMIETIAKQLATKPAGQPVLRD